jgi:hypothetical protein
MSPRLHSRGGPNAKSKKQRNLRLRDSFLDFGCRFAYNTPTPVRAAQEGRKNGKENLEESEKAGTDEAVAEKVTRSKQARPSRVRSASPNRRAPARFYLNSFAPARSYLN